MKNATAWMVAAALVSASACSLNADGVGAPSPMLAPDSGTDGSSGAGNDSSADSGADSSDQDTSDGGSGQTTGAQPGDTSDDGGPAMLVFDEAPEVDLGTVDLADGPAQLVLKVTNEGGLDALELQAVLDGDFSFAGSSGYPGEGGSCGFALSPGQSCTLAVVAPSRRFGALQSTIVFGYDSGDGLESAQVELSAFSVGTTANLLVNAGGEDMGVPPTGWQMINGDWRTVTAQARTGSRSITAGNVEGESGSYRLRQIIDIGEHAEIVDGPDGLQIALRGHGRSFSTDNDPFYLRLRTVDDTGTPSEVEAMSPLTGVDWMPMELGTVTPVGTRSIEVELVCDYVEGNNCDGYFDDIELTLTYSPS